MTLLAVLVFIPLAAIAALHVAWGFGVRWPAENERDLVALVVGARGRTTMPRLPECLVAGGAILATGIVALLLAGIVQLPLPSVVVTAAGIVAAIVFAARGAAAYVPAWRDRFLQEPFATMDRAWYGPLCLLLAASFALLLAQRWGH